jgi:uncharacterized protein YndB with AHSA1/START domain
MTRAHAITDDDIVLAEIELVVPPERAFEAPNSFEVERWRGALCLYRMEGWQADRRTGGRWQVDVVLPDGTCLPARRRIRSGAASAPCRFYPVL